MTLTRIKAAIHVLRGRPLMYGMSLTLSEPLVISQRNVRIVGNTIRGARGAS
jgi:hypothetical protein